MPPAYPAEPLPLCLYRHFLQSPHPSFFQYKAQSCRRFPEGLPSSPAYLYLLLFQMTYPAFLSSIPAFSTDKTAAPTLGESKFCNTSIGWRSVPLRTLKTISIFNNSLSCPIILIDSINGLISIFFTPSFLILSIITLSCKKKSLNLSSADC